MNDQPRVIKYLNEEMPIIIFTCCQCCVELFRAITYENKTFNKNYCMDCAMTLENEAWQYRNLCK